MSCGRCTCPFSVMLGYMALLGRSLCGGRSINSSRLCLYLSGSDGDPTGKKVNKIYLSFKLRLSTELFPRLNFMKSLLALTSDAAVPWVDHLRRSWMCRAQTGRWWTGLKCYIGSKNNFKRSDTAFLLLCRCYGVLIGCLGLQRVENSQKKF